MTYLEGVYWDLDGTIANTELEAHLPAFNNAFKDLDINWNWDTTKYIQLLRINGGKNRIAHYSRLNNDNFSDDLIFKIHQKKQFHYPHRYRRQPHCQLTDRERQMEFLGLVKF